MADQPKAIISTSIAGALGWHIWAILSLTGTGILLYLNFTKFAIGGELGGSSSSSSNILGFLQVIVKAHELAIVASLFAIAHQFIMRDLLRDGILLGLLGAEGSLANPSFLISRRFRLAVQYAFRRTDSPRSSKNNPGQLRTLQLVILITCCCVIAAFAGPASAVLMIPRIDWFFYSTDRFEAVPRSTIPTIMIGTSPGILDTDMFSESNVFALPDLIVGSTYRYWKDVSACELRSSRVTLAEKSLHQFHDYYGQVYVNTTGSFKRPLNGPWTGGTRTTTASRNNFDLHYGDSTYLPLLEVHRDWMDVKSVDTTYGFDASVTCRAREKIPCTVDSTIVENSLYPNWCYRSVHKDNRTGEVRMGQNLLMAQDFVDGHHNPRVWLTEGHRVDENKHYSDTIEVLFEKRPDDELSFIYNLTVCSFSAVLVAAVATSYGDNPKGEKLKLFDHVFRPDGTTAPPRKFLFHENWLDRAYSYDPDLWLSNSVLHSAYADGTPYTDGTPYIMGNNSYPTGSMVYPDNFTYTARPGMVPQMNSFGNLGSSLTFAIGFSFFDEAFLVEAIVGGMLTCLLSWSLPSHSQYSMPYDQIPERFRLGPPEQFSHEYTNEVYRRGYGFQLSTRTGYLGVAVLVLHAAIAIVASVWQLRRGIIRAWSTVPDYVCLGSGSRSLVVAHPNTCAGIDGANSLCGLVKVVESGHHGATPHLEIIGVGDIWTETRPVNLHNEKKRYGFSGAKDMTG